MASLFTANTTCAMIAIAAAIDVGLGTEKGRNQLVDAKDYVLIADAARFTGSTAEKVVVDHLVSMVASLESLART